MTSSLVRIGKNSVQINGGNRETMQLCCEIKKSERIVLMVSKSENKKAKAAVLWTSTAAVLSGKKASC